MSFVDTSVLVELVEVPGKSQRAAEIRAEFARRVGAKEQFVIPVTAVIETGNHIAQAKMGNRRAAAERLVSFIRTGTSDGSPFLLNRVSWDDGFLTELCGGNGTGQTLVDLAGNGQMGAGDIAILVERDRFVAGSAFSRGDVDIWTLERVLNSYA